MIINGDVGPGATKPGGLARVVADAVPLLVEQLVTTHPGRLHREAMVLLERPLILHVLALTGGNQLRAARLLGLNRNTLRKRCRTLEIRRGPRRPPPMPPPSS